MPIIITGPASTEGRLVHLAMADTTPAAEGRFEHLAMATSSVKRSLAHIARATSSSTEVRLTHLATTRAYLEARLVHSVTATAGTQAMPTRLRAGQPAQQLEITSGAGNVISAQYSHTGTRESLVLTLIGDVSPQAQLDLTVHEPPYPALTIRLDGDLIQFERQQTAMGKTTVLRAENKNASRLGSLRLPELIPWQLSPTPLPDRRVPCSARPKPQSIAISTVISAAFQQVNMGLAYPKGDPLSGLSWKEGEREYSTLGKTPDQVFADTYGQIGWLYVVRGQYAYLLPAGVGYRDVTVLPEHVTPDLTIRQEAANTPSLVSVAGADLLVNRPSLIALALDAPDRDSLIREVSPNIDWYITTPTSSGETIKGFRKTLGVVTYTNELTRSNVTVQETVDGQQRTRTFGSVVTGYTSTESTYDPYCLDALLRQRTIKQSFGYGLNTETHGRIFSGPGWGGSYEAGDTLADEEQTVYQTFSPEGYLASKTTITRKLASLEQKGADGPLDDRGPLQAREYLTQTLSEAFQPVGGGKWQRIWSLSGDQQLPLYDQETGDAVRLASRGGTFGSDQQLLDQAPEQVRCPDPCAEPKIAYPLVVRQMLADGREGLEVSRSLPFVDSAQALETLAQGIAESLAPTRSTDATLAAVQDWRPGASLRGSVTGVVEGFTLDASGGFATAKVSVRELLPSGSDTAKLPEGNGPWRDMVVWRLPGGVVVNHLKEIKDGVPQFDRIFVRATGANLPSPGDEIEWRKDTRFGPTATGNYGN